MSDYDRNGNGLNPNRELPTGRTVGGLGRGSNPQERGSNPQGIGSSLQGTGSNPQGMGGYRIPDTVKDTGRFGYYRDESADDLEYLSESEYRPGAGNSRGMRDSRAGSYGQGAGYPQRGVQTQSGSYSRDGGYRADGGFSPRQGQPDGRSQAGSYSQDQRRGQQGVNKSYEDPMAKNARAAELRRKRRKRQQAIRNIAIVLVVILLLILVAGLVFFLKDRVSVGSKGSKDGAYSRNIDITDAVTAEMALWLSSVDGGEITTEWVRQRCGQLTVTSKLTLGKNSSGKTYIEEISEDSYNRVSGQVDEALNGLLSEVIADRLVKSGYAESVTKEEAANIAVQVLEMSIADYVKENGVNILPSREQLGAAYTLGNGTYTVSKDVYTFNSSDGEKTSEKVMNKNGSLVLIDSGRVYVQGDDTSSDGQSGKGDK